VKHTETKKKKSVKGFVVHTRIEGGMPAKETKSASITTHARSNIRRIIKNKALSAAQALALAQAQGPGPRAQEIEGNSERSTQLEAVWP
jgi:hypothetical protein